MFCTSVWFLFYVFGIPFSKGLEAIVKEIMIIIMVDMEEIEPIMAWMIQGKPFMSHMCLI